jgi:hypothetical protein
VLVVLHLSRASKVVFVAWNGARTGLTS